MATILALVAALVLALVVAARSGFDLQRLREDLGDAATRLRTTVAEQATRLTEPAQRGTQGGDEGAVTGHVAVYFAPVAHGDRGGIDDHFLRFLRSARTSIFCALYELQWMDAAQALIDRHRAGVAVKIVSDSDYEGREAIKACIAAGIPVVFDKRSAFMHDKFCVVDGERVWTGSTNITENGLYRNDNNSLSIASPQLAADYSSEFGEMFAEHKFGPRSPRATVYPVVSVDGISIECYFAPEDGVRDEILREVDAADKTIDFMAFSFTADELAEAMTKRMKLGVLVRGLFESRNANSRYSDDEFLSRQGGTIRMDKNPYTMHNKVIVIDGDTVVTGSYNFSSAAEEDNDENVLIIHSPAVAERFTRRFEALFN